jgi:hypothetical protein
MNYMQPFFEPFFKSRILKCQRKKISRLIWARKFGSRILKSMADWGLGVLPQVEGRIIFVSISPPASQ